MSLLSTSLNNVIYILSALFENHQKEPIKASFRHFGQNRIFESGQGTSPKDCLFSNAYHLNNV